MSNERVPGDTEELTYASYLALNELLALQRPRSDEHDELLFITIHQTYELWFKQILHEVRGAMSALAANESWRASHRLSRVRHILKIAVAQVDILETLTPSNLPRSAAGSQPPVDLNQRSSARSRRSSGSATRVSPTYSQMSRPERLCAPPYGRRAFGTQRSTGWRSVDAPSRPDSSSAMCRSPMKEMRNFRRCCLGSIVLAVKRPAFSNSSLISMRGFRSGAIATSRWWSEPLAESQAQVVRPVWNISLRAYVVRYSQTFGLFATACS